MRIALFAETFAPQVNGVARTLARLLAHLRARGHEVALVTPRIAPHEAADAALHVRLPALPAPFYPELRLGRTLDRASGRRLAAFAPDLVHVTGEAFVGWSGRRWAGEQGVPLVTSFHTDIPTYLADYGFRGLERQAWAFLRRLHEHARLTFAPSGATLAQLRANGFHPRLRLWSRGVDASLFSPDRRAAQARERIAPGARSIVLYVGRLAAEKRIGVLLEAWERVRPMLPGRGTLVIVGEGPEGPALRARAGADVRFTGVLAGEALAEAYAAADLFVSPSDTETFGNTVLEALASGVPAVVADRGGVTEIVRHGENGLHAAAGDSRAFASAMLTLLGDEVLRARMAAASREAARGRSWESVLDGLIADYREAADARGSELAA
jgi:phosphatidylinositol alpha 1,6-mannosyltransferase